MNDWDNPLAFENASSEPKPEAKAEQKRQHLLLKIPLSFLIQGLQPWEMSTNPAADTKQNIIPDSVPPYHQPNNAGNNLEGDLASYETDGIESEAVISEEVAHSTAQESPSSPDYT